MNRTLVSLLLVVCLGLPAYSQSLTSLTGSVVDPSGAAVPGANITITNTGDNTKREVVSDASGKYSLLAVNPGTYRLVAKKSGFSDISVTKIQLLVNTPATLNLTFETVGSVAQTIEISAEGVQLNTVDATVGNSFGAKPITQLPLEGRKADRLLSLQPGISYIGDNDTVNGGSDVGTDRGGVVNGGRSDQSNITLDGVDINNQQTREPFNGALRVTLDSVQEFRVTTSNANADSSRGSGAQITLITRSGSNELHGAAYWFVRNKMFNSNTFFNNSTLGADGRGLPTPKLNRNIYGGRLGGPIKKNKLFYFANWEGQQDRFEQSVVRTVPRENLRNGIIDYLSVGGARVSVPSSELLSRLDGAGSVNQAALQVLRAYPLPNDFTTGDGINTAGFRFNSPLRRRYNTYVAKIDYVVNDRNRLFARGQLQNDNEGFAPQFPGAAPNRVDLNNSKGLALGWDSTINNSLISSTRWGLTRQGVETSGIGTYPIVTFRNIDPLVGTTRSFRRFSPTYNFTQDFTWTKGKHTIQFGGSIRVFQNDRSNFANSFFTGVTNSSWMTASGAVLSAPWADASLGNNRINAGSRTSFNDATVALLGIVTQVTSRYNYMPKADGSVTAQAPGTPVLRNFQGEEAEMYISDTWKATRNLTITGGLRYMHWPAIYEKNGVQTSPNIPLSQWFDTRVANAGNGLAGGAGLPPISYQLANKGGRPLYDNLKNWSPRLGIAYAPDAKSGLAKLLFGGPGKSVIRAGFGIYYDVFGSGLVRDFDASALGLSTSLNNASGRETIAGAPRFTGLFNIPPGLVSPPPPAQFPVTQPNNFAITNSLDDRLRAPYTLRYNLSINRELASGWTVNAGYVASQGKRTITSEDLATPLNIRDPRSNIDYFTAARALTDQIRRSTPVSQVNPIPFWENLFPGLAGQGRTATQNAYLLYDDFFPDSTGALENMDRFGDPSASALGRFAFYSPQFSYLRALRSVGFSTYNSFQLGAQKRFSNGDTVGFNWTWSHAIDLGSTSEENATASRGILINPYNRYQMRASADFDQRHNFNANFVYGLPFGKGKKFLSGASTAANTILGGWQLGGIWRQTSGLPISVGHNRTWPTNYNITGFATQIANVADGTNKNAPAPPGGRSGPNIFVDPAAALRAFDFTSPGEIGTRNSVRGDGLFNIDMNLNKNFTIREGHTLQLRWEVFNVTNSVRFDPLNINLALSNPSAFGRYAGTLGGPRVMQFGLRYDF
ncbi:MAG: carboxypeptidase regulatory-like domain-containing protein [Acidobacteriota bacterium]